MPIKKIGALHYDSGKPRIELIPFASLEAEAAGMEYGVIKYSRDDWRLGMEICKLIASTLRHVVKFNDTESYDIESGCSHIDHAKADLGILAELLRSRPDLDNRHAGIRRQPYTLEEILAYRKSKGLKTDDKMLAFINRNVEKATKDYENWRKHGQGHSG